MSVIKEKTEQYLQEIIEIRRDIHRHPELSGKVVRTSALIREKLQEYGVDKIEEPVPTAVVALIYGSKGAGRCVALRCDVDALPVQEETGLPFASENPGCMHACGHDMHASMMLGVAKILCEMRDSFAGCVKLIFQHNEEVHPGGSRELLAKGVLENPHVDAIFATHMLPDEERVGQVGLYVGPVTSTCDLYEITVSGKGGHGSAPQTSTDPLVASAQMLVMLQQIVSRRLDPMETAVFSITNIHGGDTINVIPPEIKFSGMSREYSDEVQAKIKEEVFAIAKGIEVSTGNHVNVHYEASFPSVINDKELIEIASDAIEKELGAEAVVHMTRPMTFSEDYAYYGRIGGIPSAFMLLYAGHEGDQVMPLHNPKCTFKEEAMPVGIGAMAATALAFLNKQ